MTKVTKRGKMRWARKRAMVGNYLFGRFQGKIQVVVVGLAMLTAVLLPLPLLVSQRFHHDEALYSTWALQIVSGIDPWLAQTPIDKPPLFIYLIAGAMKLLGVTETAARIPSLLATVVTAGLTFWLGRTLYGDGVGMTAAWLVALSPFTILFAPTAFTDPLLVALVLTACLAASHGRAAWAGLALGLGIATKQQGIFFGPLVIGLLIFYNWPKRSEVKIANYVLRFTLTLILTLLPLILWDLIRQTPSFLTQSAVNYGGLTSEAASFSERWDEFIELLQYGTASPGLNLVFIGGLPVLLLYGVITAGRRPPVAENIIVKPLTWPLPGSLVWADSLLALFSLVFLFGHALFSFQVWDRYLLGLIPFLALLLARILLLPWLILTRIRFHSSENSPHPLPPLPPSGEGSRASDGVRGFSFLVSSRLGLSDPGEAETQASSHALFLPVSGILWLKLNWRLLAGAVYSLALAAILAVTLAGPGQDAVNGRYPLGSHSQALSGIEQITAYLQGHAGANHTLYHRWLGTHWRFYLWGYPYDLQYWASPQELAAKAKPGHLIVFPSWQSDTEARLSLAQAGLELRELTRAYNSAGYPSLILYQIVPVTGQQQAGD